MTITRFEDIHAWQAARELSKVVYRFTGNEKFSRDFGLVDQARRAAVSVMANIAEGFDARIPNLFSSSIMHSDPHRSSKAISTSRWTRVTWSNLSLARPMKKRAK
jgi:hypothetical protein